MDQLVICPLQERRIDGEYRTDAARRKPCRKCNPMRLGDPYVKKPPGIQLPELPKACPIRHRSRDRHDLRMLLRFVT